ncbi:hypothetical protein Droror1_Dr00027366 [Drosera rotundifolia]
MAWNALFWYQRCNACNAYGILCVPLYDTLAIEGLAQHKGILEKVGKVTPEQKEEVTNQGLTIYNWDEFLEMEVGQEYKLPEKKKSDICMIMYTSGTTGDPKGVLIPNGSLVAVIAGLRHHMMAGNIAYYGRTRGASPVQEPVQEEEYEE